MTSKMLTQVILRTLLIAGIVLADPPRIITSLPSSSLFSPLAPATPMKAGCPRREDIHPCECLEIPKTDSVSGEAEVETVAFCKTIRNTQVLQNAMKGMQGHVIDFMVLDSCKLPPFPNGLFFNVGIKWMEILNSTVQLKQNFFECATNCWYRTLTYKLPQLSNELQRYLQTDGVYSRVTRHFLEYILFPDHVLDLF